MSLVLAFGGPAEHGKSTSAKIAEDYFISVGWRIKVISFADRLKEVCKIIFRLTDRDLNNTICKSTMRAHLGTTPREIMQKFGTEVCRDGISRHLPVIADKTIWTWNMEKDIEEITQENVADVIIIPDLRFPDELSMLRQFNLIFINVTRPGLKSPAMNHSSEEGLLACKPDFNLLNDGTLDELKEKLHAILFNCTCPEEEEQCL
jgi:hypothetical protein